VSQIVSPYLLFLGLLVAAIGVAVAIPRRRVNPQAIGAVVAGGGLGMILLSLAISNPSALPNLHFYIFGLIALGASLRVITHPRPVYAALFFILTILASCGLYVILAAEFLAFALIIIYAGAILITYLFVIMLATQAPSEDRIEVLAEYDVAGREPVVAVTASFVLLAALTALIFTGVPTLTPDQGVSTASVMERMPGKAERLLREQGLIARGDEVVRVDGEQGTALVQGSEGLMTVALPAGMEPTNVELVGFDLLAEHPGTIEIAGIILLMAMVGATVLARRQADIEDEAKYRAAEALRYRGGLVADPLPDSRGEGA
jgi:NADH-quinone oxidoreductase subunit J